MVLFVGGQGQGKEDEHNARDEDKNGKMRQDGQDLKEE